MRGLFKNRFTTLSLSLAAMLVLAACGGGGNGNNDVPDTFNVNVSASAGGSVISDDEKIDTESEMFTAAYEEGAVVTLTAIPDEGFGLASWGNASCDDGSLSCELTVGTEDIDVDVVFSAITSETFGAESSAEEFLEDGDDSLAYAGNVQIGDNLELGIEPAANYEVRQMVAVRFVDVDLTSADGVYVEFTAQDYQGRGFGSEGAVDLVISGDASGAEFTADDEALSSRDTVETTIPWVIEANDSITAETVYRSPNLAELVQEMQAAGATDLVFYFSATEDNGLNYRYVHMANADEDTANEPRLVVESLADDTDGEAEE